MPALDTVINAMLTRSRAKLIMASAISGTVSAYLHAKKRVVVEDGGPVDHQSTDRWSEPERDLDAVLRSGSCQPDERVHDRLTTHEPRCGFAHHLGSGRR